MKQVHLSIAFALLASLFTPFIASAQNAADKLKITSRIVGPKRPEWSHAYYTEPTGIRLARAGSVSEDNGKTWKPFSPKPDFSAGLPFGYRREQGTSIIDPKNGHFVLMMDALDTPGLDPKAIEPPIAFNEYYMRYRVSADGGRTWLFDEPIVHTGGKFTEREPFEGIKRGVNALMSGDCGTFPIITRTGRILYPAQATMMKNGWSDGKTDYQGGLFSEKGPIAKGTGLAWPAIVKAAQTNPAIKARVEMLVHRVPEEFFDLSNDRFERHNLIADATRQKEIESMRSDLLSVMQRTGDPFTDAFAHRDDRSVYLSARDKVNAQFNKPAPKMKPPAAK